MSFRWRPEIDSLMDQLTAKTSQRSQVTKAKVKTTQPQEFTLSKPKPPPVSPPLERTPQQEKFKPVGLIHFLTTSNLFCLVFS